MIEEYDANQDGTLDYIEFMQMVLPASDLELRHSASVRQPYAIYNTDE